MSPAQEITTVTGVAIILATGLLISSGIAFRQQSQASQTPVGISSGTSTQLFPPPIDAQKSSVLSQERQQIWTSSSSLEALTRYYSSLLEKNGWEVTTTKQESSTTLTGKKSQTVETIFITLSRNQDSKKSTIAVSVLP